MADLFSLDEFGSYLQQDDVDTSSATVARRVASGWLLAATGLTSFVTVDDRLFAWGLELAAMAYRNPDGATSESTDDHNVSWDGERRREILAAARTAYSGSGLPLYSFPEPDWHWDAVPTVSVLE